MSRGWRFANCDDPDPENPDDWEKHEEAVWSWELTEMVTQEVDCDDHEEAASLFGWDDMWPDLLAEGCTSFEVWVKSPEGEVKRLHVDVSFSPEFSASEVETGGAS